MNQTCKMVREQLSSYIDGVLDEREREIVEEHVATCDACRSEFEFLKAISQVTQSLPKLSVRSGLHDEIMAGVKLTAGQMKEPKKKRYSFFKTVSGFAVAAAVVAFSVISLNSLPGHPELTPEVVTKSTQSAPQIPEAILRAYETETPVSDLPAAPENKQSEQSLVAEKATHAPAANVPEVASLPVEPDVASSVSAAFDEVALPETADEPMTAGGGGGSAGGARMIMRPVVTYHVTAESYEEALALLSSYEKNEDGYLVPADVLLFLAEQMESLPGYINRSGEERVDERGMVCLTVISE